MQQQVHSTEANMAKFYFHCEPACYNARSASYDATKSTPGWVTVEADSYEAALPLIPLAGRKVVKEFIKAYRLQNEDTEFEDIADLLSCAAAEGGFGMKFNFFNQDDWDNFD